MVGEVVHARLLREVAQREGDVARQLVQQAHLLLVEEVALARIEQQDAGALARGEQRQRHERAALRVVPYQRARAELEARDVALGAAFAGRRDLLHRVRERIGEADRGEAEAALLHRDAARLVEQRLAVVRAHDQRVHRAQHLERAVQPLDAALLRLQRGGLLQQLVDHHAQVLAVEVARHGARPGARGQHLVHGGEDGVVVGRLDQHARHAVRERQVLRLLRAEVGGVEQHHGARGGRVELQPPRQLVAVHLRHQDVGDDQLRPVLARALQRLPAVGGRHHAVPGGLEQRRHRVAVRPVVVGYEDRRHAFHGQAPHRVSFVVVRLQVVG